VHDKSAEATGNFLNVMLDGKPPELKEGEDMHTWTVPESGVLSFDYISPVKIFKSAHHLREEVFQSFTRELANPALSEATKLLMLRTAATTHYYTSEQVRTLIRLIEYRSRIDAVVMLFKRVVDPQKFVSRVYSLLKEDETKMLRSRLGPGLTRDGVELPDSEWAKDRKATPPAPPAESVAVFLTEEGGSLQPDAYQPELT